MPPVVREVAPRDCGAIAEIYRHYVLTTVSTFEESPPTEGEWRVRITSMMKDNIPFVVAEADDAVVGYAYVTTWKPKPAYKFTGEVTIYVAAGSTGKGIGRQLLANLIERCANVGLTQLIAVIVDTADNASLALHRTLGFEQAGVLKRVGFKHGRWLDTILMQRSVSS